MSGSGAERRRYKRIPARLVAHFRRGSEPAHQAITQNISLGGVFIETHIEFAIGDPVEFDLHLPTEKNNDSVKIAVRGRVCWRQQRPIPGIGVDMQSITSKNRRHVTRYIRRHERNLSESQEINLSDLPPGVSRT